MTRVFAAASIAANVAILALLALITAATVVPNDMAAVVRHSTATNPIHRIADGPTSYQIVAKEYRDYSIIANTTRAWISKDGTQAFEIVPGLTGDNTKSFRLAGTELYLRHRSFKFVLGKDDGTALFKKDASFFERKQLNNDGYSYEAVNDNLADYYMRHQGFELKLMKDDGSDSSLFQDDITWYKYSPKPTPAPEVPSNLLKYGNHCGFSHGDYSKSGSGGGKHIDNVDLACKNHDRCVEEKGFPNCYCDTIFRRDLVNLKTNSEVEEFYRNYFHQIFKIAPCKYPQMGDSIKMCETCLFGKCIPLPCGTERKCKMVLGVAVHTTKNTC